MCRWTWVLLLSSGCQRCGGDPFVDDKDSPDVVDDTPDASDPPAPDTAPEPMCAFPEQEPNNSAAQGTPLPLEQVACGTFAEEYDGDFWLFEVKEPGWIAVDLAGLQLGSDAKLSLTLSSDDGVRVGALDSNGLPEAHLAFPVAPAHYQALVRQAVGSAGGQGAGDDYFYHLRASSTKPRVTWDVAEGPNEARGAAQRLLASGEGSETVFGALSTAEDQDWYEVRVPAARYRLTARVVAHAEGSGGDFALQVWEDGVNTGTWAYGPVGWEKDPYFVLRSLAGETVQIRVVEEGSDYGAPYWYALSIELVEE